MKKILIACVVSFALVSPVFAQQGGRMDASGTNPGVGACPQFSAMYEEGYCSQGTIVSGGIGPDGCPRPPRCDMSQVREQLREEIRTMRGDLKEELEQKREELRNQFQGILLGSTTVTRDVLREFEGMRQMLRDESEAKRETFRAEVEIRIEAAKKQMEQAREEFKKRLEQFKDEKKKQALERISENIGEANKHLTEQFIETLDRLSEVLVNIGSRVEKAAVNGADVTAVRAAMTAAETAIQTARAAVVVQAGKVYALTIESEDAARAGASATKQALEGDLKSVRTLVQAARDAVRAAAIALAAIPGINGFEVTNTSTTVPATQ